jgi:hypothetical protein
MWHRQSGFGNRLVPIKNQIEIERARRLFEGTFPAPLAFNLQQLIEQLTRG